MAEINLGTLYDFNKEAMKNEKIIDPILFNQKLNEINKEIADGAYWMLLCHDRRDYSIIHKVNTPSIFPKEMSETLLNRGHVLSIDLQPDGAWEIWIRDFDGEDVFAYYLFNYDTGVIEV